MSAVLTNATEQAVRFIEQIRCEDVPGDAELDAKFRACAGDLLDEARQAKVIEAAWQIERLPR